MPVEWICDYCGGEQTGEPCPLQLDAGIVWVCGKCSGLLKNKEEGGH